MHVFFSVGEPSGDQHAALLIQELRRRQPTLRVSGFGGDEMRAAGCQLLYPLTALAVMGIFRVIPLLYRFYKLVKQAEAYFERHHPDLVVLVDFPGFNWWIARKAKKLGIPVVYYLPPQLWAWAPWRISRVKKYIDLVLSGLAFETEWYAQRNVPVLYVGHPFFDEVHHKPLDVAFCREWQQADQPIVALLPGSRGHEVTGHWPLMLQVARRIHSRHPQARFLVANYKPAQKQYCQEQYEASGIDLPITFHLGHTSEIIQIATCAFMVSGSVSLEMLARGTPATVVYRCSWLMYFIGKLLVTVKYMSLPNLMAGRQIMPEYLCVGDPEPVVEHVTGHLDGWLAEPEARAAAVQELQQLRDVVYSVGATERVAGVILDRLSASANATAASRAA